MISHPKNSIIFEEFHSTNCIKFLFLKRVYYLNSKLICIIYDYKKKKYLKQLLYLKNFCSIKSSIICIEWIQYILYKSNKLSILWIWMKSEKSHLWVMTLSSRDMYVYHDMILTFQYRSWQLICLDTRLKLLPW